MSADHERERLAATFDRAAELYHRARPEYPSGLYDHLVGIAMQDWQRERLYGEIRRHLARRPDGLLRRHWGGVLQVARRRFP